VTLRQRKLAESREHVVQEAIRLFAARGYDNVTVDEIAEAANVARRTVHRYYPVKADLVLGSPADTEALVSPFVDSIPTSGPLSAAVLGVVRMLAEQWPFDRDVSADRTRIIEGSDELRARELAKRAAVAAYLRHALIRLRPDDEDGERHLWSDLTVSLFFIAHERWISGNGDLVSHFDRVVEQTCHGLLTSSDG
jgi:AcrR family transcriptional regulator